MTVLICPKCRAQLDLRYDLSLWLTPNPSWRNLPLDELELSIRSYNCLHNMGCETAGAVADMTDRELLRWPNFGQRSLREVREVLARLKAQEPQR